MEEWETNNLNAGRYKRRDGSSNMAGELYEVKIAGLLFLRALSDKIPFRIASNMAAAGDFDDVVFQQRHRTLFLQTKHRISEKRSISREQLTKKRGDFSLQMYFESYCKIKENWDEDEDLNFCRSIDNSTFVLYTSAKLNDGLGTGNRDYSSLLSFLTSNPEGKCTLFSQDLLPNNTDNFFDQFIFLSEQATETDLESIIKQELEQLCGSDNDNEKYKKFMEIMQKWWRESQHFLSEHVGFWQEFVTTCASNVSDEKYNSSLNLGIKFKHDPRLSDCLKSEPVVHVRPQSAEGSELLAYLKVHNHLNTQPHIIVDKLTPDVLTLWKGVCHVLVLVLMVWTTEEEKSLRNILDIDKRKRLIVIQQNITVENCTTIEENISIEQLEEASQMRILDEEVNFQGQLVRLREITGSRDNLLSPVAIIQALKKNIKLGTTLSGDLSYYIPRTLCIKRGSEIPAKPESDKEVTIAVSGISERDMSKISRKFKNCELELISPENTFDRLKTSHANIHWLHWNGSSFTWKDSQGDMTTLLENLTENCNFENVNSIADIPLRATLVSADSGMGKSTLLAHLAFGTKKRYPSMWVIKVDLLLHKKLLSEMPSEPNIDDVFDFLMVTSEIPSEWNGLFRCKLESMQNLCVLFDGYDEICPENAERITEILKRLLSNKLDKLCLTSRPLSNHELQRSIPIQELHMTPFSESDQEKFFVSFWRGSDSGIVKKFIDEFKLKTRRIGNQEKTFAEIPLQCLLLGEAYKHNIKAGVTDLSNYFSLSQLYEKCINNKVQIYFNKERIYERSHVAIELEEDYKHRFMLAALSLLLSPNDFYNFIVPENELHSVQRKIENGTTGRIGICQNVDGSISFIHGTFVEYFSALWFSKYFDQCRPFLIENLLKPKFKTVRYFFDHILSETNALHKAVLTFNTNLIERLVISGNGVNVQDKAGRTPLHLALMCLVDSHDGDDTYIKSLPNNDTVLRIMSLLLKHGAQTDVKDCMYELTAMELSVNIKAWSVVDLFLENKVEPTGLILNSFITDVILTCSRQGLVHLLDYMLRRRLIDVNQILGEEKQTMLHEAVKHEQDLFVTRLLDKGADIAVKDTNGKTAFDYSLDCENFNILDQIKSHINKIRAERIGEEIEMAVRNGNVKDAALKCIVSGNAERLNSLLDSEELNINDLEGGYSSLMVAISVGEFDIFELLLQRGVDITFENEHGFNALHLAALSGNVRMINALLDTGNIKIDCPVHNGQTAFHIAVFRGNPETCKLLMERGANIKLKDKENQSALVMASLSGNEEIVTLLLQKELDINQRDKNGNTPLLHAMKKGHHGVCKILLENNADCSFLDNDGNNALHIAAKSGTTEIMTILLNMKVVDINICNKDGSTALLLAAGKNHSDVCELLLRHQADVRICNNNGSSALHFTARSGATDVATLLLNSGPIDVDGVDNDGNTALILAAMGGHVEICEYLIEKGADIAACNKQNYNALHFALESGNEETVNLLLNF